MDFLKIFYQKLNSVSSNLDGSCVVLQYFR